MTRLVFDIETTGLDWNSPDAKMHVMCTTDVDDINLVADFNDPYEAVDYLNSQELLIGHYIQFFDIPYLEAITGKKITTPVFDTKVMAGLMFPERKSHSLESWGDTLGLPKKTEFTYTDFTKCTPEMIEQCHRDVEITAQLHSYLMQQNIAIEAQQLETQVAMIIQKQIARGVGFDTKAAIDLYGNLFAEYNTKKKALQLIFPPRTKTTQMKTKVKEEIIPFNPNSNDDIAERLKEKYNWNPEKYTPKGKPAVDIAVLSALDYPETRMLIEMSQIGKMMGYVSDGADSWLRHEKKGKIHGRINTTGVVTGRMSHFAPNMAQVPRGGKHADQCRSLFIPSTGNVLVGCDASALELRCLAHYLAPYDNGRLTKIIEEGDIHQSNADILTCSRDMAKHFIYAFIYGAKGKKLAEVLGCSLNNAKDMQIKFEKSFPGFKEFYAVLTNASTRGYINGLDGRKILTPMTANTYNGGMDANYKRLNYLLQSAGAIIMKKALCIAYDKNPDLAFVLNVHDEIQVDSSKEEVYNVGKLLVDSIFEAGEYFKFRCPVRAEFKVGNNWNETH
jgi:DNA polymerase I-like protein with 3'-5' exonuclease and polymerase domains